MLGIIGGSSLSQIAGLEAIDTVTVETPFGMHSTAITTGMLRGRQVAFLSRHGDGHSISPTQVPYRANIYALRSLGVTHLLSISAVGSLREHLAPGTTVIPEQIIDRTTHRPHSFFEHSAVVHVGLANPYSPAFNTSIHQAAATIGAPAIIGGTYICIEGPQFSTRAESHLYRSWGADIVGMTAMPEARLAREAGICYSTIAMVTDYDVWHDTEDDVTAEAVRAIITANQRTAQDLISAVAASGLPDPEPECINALSGAVMTDRAQIRPDDQAIIDALTA